MSLSLNYSRGLYALGGELKLAVQEANDYVPLCSELPGVSDLAWDAFVRGMMSAKLDAVSPSNKVGMFELSPRRLADLGVVQSLTRTQSPADAKRAIYVAEFVPPLTREKFLASPRAQYKVFSASVKNYDDQLRSGEIKNDENLSRSGALALLHRAGPNALEMWKTKERFPSTVASYEKVAGVF